MGKFRRVPRRFNWGQRVADLLARAAKSLGASEPKPDALIVDLRERIDEVVEFSGCGCWTTCSGCYETEDGYPNGHYPYSVILECTLGGGCSECGGIGAVWDDTDYEAMVRDMLAEDRAARQTPSDDGAR